MRWKAASLMKSHEGTCWVCHTADSPRALVAGAHTNS